MSKFGDLDDDNFFDTLAKTHGEAEARLLLDRLGQCYEERSFVFMAIRQDLSREAPSETSNE